MVRAQMRQPCGALVYAQGAGISTINVSGEMAYNTLQLRGTVVAEHHLLQEICAATVAVRWAES